jgi:hypothetical protein
MEITYRVLVDSILCKANIYMKYSIRASLKRVQAEETFVVTAPDIKNRTGMMQYRLIWAARLHHERLFLLPDGGFYQANLAILSHQETKQPHAFIIASHEDHEGPWQEFILCDELLDCSNWDDFLDNLYGYKLDSGLDLTITNRDAFVELIPEWLDVFV